MYEAYMAGDKAKAKELQSLLFETMPLAKDIRIPVKVVRPAFQLAIRQGIGIPLDAAPTQSRLKAALARRGVAIKPITRSPLPPLTSQDERAIQAAIERIDRLEPVRSL